MRQEEGSSTRTVYYQPVTQNDCNQLHGEWTNDSNAIFSQVDQETF